MRIINFNDTRFGKNSNNFAGSEPIVIPSPDKMGLFLGDLVDKCKSFRVKNEKEEKFLLSEKADILSAIKTLADEKGKDALRKRIETTFQRSPSIKSFLLEKLAQATIGTKPETTEPAPQTEGDVELSIKFSETKDYISTAQNAEDCNVISNRVLNLPFSDAQKNVLRKLFTDKIGALGLKYNKETKTYE
jgi:hypothetical protein